jgi:hypothetical protein
MKDCEDCLSHVQSLFVEYHGQSNELERLAEILQILEQNQFHYRLDIPSLYISPDSFHQSTAKRQFQVNILAQRTRFSQSSTKA